MEIGLTREQTVLFFSKQTVFHCAKDSLSRRSAFAVKGQRRLESVYFYLCSSEFCLMMSLWCFQHLIDLCLMQTDERVEQVERP